MRSTTMACAVGAPAARRRVRARSATPPGLHHRQSEGGGDDFADDTSLVTPRSDDLTVVGAVSSADGAVYQPGRASGSYGPVNFQYVDERTRVR
jgi:hypothetical protein